MSFPRYPEYKDSGVAWLGSVPTHWQAKRTGYFFQERREKVSDKDFDALSVTKNGVVPQLETAAKTDDGDNRKKVCAGDFVINSRSDRKGSAGAADRDGSVSLISTVLRPRDEIEIKFAHHLLRSELFQEEFYRFGKGIVADLWSTNFTEMRNIVLAIPPLQEQRAIATFLDRETAKIDALVAEQEKLIALLQEKRQAVISHAVTKGLDPNVPMKDSGVEWLGEVSVHWEVCALRRVIAAIEQGWSPECYAREAEEQEWGVLKAGCLNGGNFRPSENKALPPELPPEEAYEVRVGDVLMSRASGSPELVGSTALVKATRERLMLSDKIFRLKLKEFVNAAFFVAALNSRPLRIQIENALSGGNGMANNLPQSSLLTFAMAVPPLAEQTTITVFLEQETAKLDTLTAEARSAITLLQERRTALISAAVTGQIDVRGLAGSANAPDSVAASAYPASA